MAAMPEEPVRTDIGYVDGYIIDLHSIAGLSGSPVFVNPPSVWCDEQSGLRRRVWGTPIPLGMLLGHHVIESKEDEMVIDEFQTAGSIDEPGVLTAKNTGFGVVIPLARLCEILEAPAAVESMRSAVKEHRRNSGFVPDARSGD